MNRTIEWKKTQAGSTEAVQFSDGMLVTAEDLGAAMRYPLSVIQVLLKAYFGCGIVCGLELRKPPEPKPEEVGEGEDARQGGGKPPQCDPNFVLTVERGVALGCDGYPIEVCGPLKLDLTPDPCRPDRGRPKEMFIAARRVTAAEAAARSCGCGSTGGEPAQQCSRVRDHVLVQAFDKLPADICRIAPPSGGESANRTAAGADPGQAATGSAADCDRLKQCEECACCGEPWVLLGSVIVDDATGLGALDLSGRKFVKPIACICPAPVPNRDSSPPPAPAPVEPEPR